MGELKDFLLSLSNGRWVRIQTVAPGTFRFRMNETGHFAEPASVRYQIVSAILEAERDVYTAPPGSVVDFRSGQAMLRMDGGDGQFRLFGADGGERVATSASPWSSDKSGFGVRLQLGGDEALYGLGNIAPERMQRRGLRVEMWGEKQLWASAPIPFLMSSSGWAVMVNTTWRHLFDIGASNENELLIEGLAGELDLFLFAGNDYAELLDAYTNVAGKPPLLPIWMYGLNFCSRIGSSARDVLDDAIKFRRAGTPCDLIGLNDDWMERAKDFSTTKRWHPVRFPTSTNDLLRQVSFIGILHKQGFKLSLALGCDYDLTVLEERLAGENMGSEWEYRNDGYREDAQPLHEESWYEHLRKFVVDGVSAFVLHPNNPMHGDPGRIWGNGMSSAELHNLYPVLLCKQMYTGFLKQTNKRPAILIERGYLGMQRFAASTTGTFYDAKHAIVAILNYGLSGHVHTTTNMHLISREGIHADFLLAWSRINSMDHFQHPDFLEHPLKELFQRYARLRYRLIPYLYSTAHAAARTGMPITRAMPLMYPRDRHCRELDGQYMLGDSLLVAVYTESVYLPEGDWFDYWTGKRYCGPCRIDVSVPPEAGGPLFVRAGAIIPMWPPMDYIGERRVETLTLEIYPGAHGSFLLYEDDGATLDYLEGASVRTRLECASDQAMTTVRIAKREGTFAGMADKRSYELIVRTNAKPAAVRVGVERRPDRTARNKSDPFRSWRYDRLAGTVRLHVAEAEFGEEGVCIEIVHPSKSGRSAAARNGAERRSAASVDPFSGPAASVLGRGISDAAGGGGDAVSDDLEADNAFAAALDSGELRVAEAALTEWWGAKMKQAPSAANAVWQLHVMKGCYLIVRQAERSGWTSAGAFKHMEDEASELAQLQKPEQGFELLLRLVSRLIRQMDAPHPRAKHPVIRELLVLALREPERDLSLNAMAERFALHPVHISRLFKKETGRNYYDYVISMRMMRAKQLLREGHKVYDAAALCGFKDAGNFSKAFSKYWGEPPVSFKQERS
ncbi:TIM-barrel domain-containing protein [Paenibacillus mesophilus]|uniref:TIM-barrel domain-containing protein n=1 Tax=Paenibacillus mesophilus TaxID=2582849 RepID=UPI001305250B|nr:TIM-barrel domain-containing protein [Paenibacillus mesophilus]